MVSDGPEENLPRNVLLHCLHPHVSVTLLTCGNDNPLEAFAELVEFLRREPRSIASRQVRLEAQMRWTSGDPIEGDIAALLFATGVRDVAAFIWEVIAPARWSDSAAGFLNRTHQLNLAVCRGQLTAVYGEGSTPDRLQRWLDQEPEPSWRRVDAAIFEAVLLDGAVKSLWLRGTHARRATKPDSKSISGDEVQHALDPIHDASFALGSARVKLSHGEYGPVLPGTVGTTLRASSVWLTASISSFEHYVQSITDLLTLIENTDPADDAATRPLSVLARRISDTTKVEGAYDISLPLPEEPTPWLDVDEGQQEYLELLHQASWAVQGQQGSIAFDLDVGMKGNPAGLLHVEPKPTRDGFELTIEVGQNPSDSAALTEIKEALDNCPAPTIYYRSGHAFLADGFYLDEVPAVHFTNWKWCDFTDYNIDAEKPEYKQTQKIHSVIGKAGDKSLFGWVVNHYQAGWLICDDGSEEIADFLHISDDLTLTFIHVKGAGNASDGRGIAVVPYEGVVSQASKNVIFMDSATLSRQLRKPRIANPACWVNGRRTDDRRAAFLKQLKRRDATSRISIVIVQPHVSKKVYSRAITATGTLTDDQLRLRRLEYLLTTTRSGIIGSGCHDFEVIGSLD